MCFYPVGLGVDTLCVSDFEQLLSDEFMARAFTAYETKNRSGPDRARRLAGCFALKEAVLKALGTGWSEDTAFTDVEVRNEPSGQPTVTLSGAPSLIARAHGIERWLVSLSHGRDYATAAAVALAAAPQSSDASGA